MDCVLRSLDDRMGKQWAHCSQILGGLADIPTKDLTSIISYNVLSSP
jgi:hypothetical protein